MSQRDAWAEAQLVVEHEAASLSDALRRRGYGAGVEIWYRGDRQPNPWVLYCEAAAFPHIAATTLAGACLKGYAAVATLPDLSGYASDFAGPLVGPP